MGFMHVTVFLHSQTQKTSNNVVNRAIGAELC